MSEMINNISNDTAQTEASECVITLKTGYRTYENYLIRVQDIYNRTKEEFFKLSPDDGRLLSAAERWRAAAVSMMRWAGSFYRKWNGTAEERALAMKIMDLVTKDSATRCDNVSQYYDLLAQKNPDNEKALLDAEKADLKHLEVLSRMIETQARYIRLEIESPYYESKEMRLEKKASEGIRETYDRIPEGHSYRPAMPYPPERIPEDEPVPDLPDPIAKVENVPLEHKDYDEDLDEFVLKKGYVSPDGLIDDKSVIFHPETHEIEFGYVGGVRARWKYWKAKDDRDVPDPKSWVVEYYQRYYAQFVLAPEYGILDPRWDEMEVPEYNKIPEGNRQ